LPGRPLIVEQAGEQPHHLAVLGLQLLAPFRSANDRSSSPSNRTEQLFGIESQARSCGLPEVRQQRLEDVA